MSEERRGGLLSVLPLETDRLRIRLFTEEDSAGLYGLHRDYRVTRFAGGLKTQEESQRILNEIVARTAHDGFGPLAVEQLVNRELIGWCGIQRLPSSEAFELIYALRPDMWGRGLAMEASTAMVEHAMQLPQPIVEIWALVYRENVRSIRLLKKLGMRFVEQRFDRRAQRYADAYRVERDRFFAMSDNPYLSSSK